MKFDLESNVKLFLQGICPGWDKSIFFPLALPTTAKLLGTGKSVTLYCVLWLKLKWVILGYYSINF